MHMCSHRLSFPPRRGTRLVSEGLKLDLQVERHTSLVRRVRRRLCTHKTRAGKLVPMTSTLTNSNRINIPAVCRLRERNTNKTVGSGVLVAPGLLLTSATAIPTQSRATHVVATFFEGTKKSAVDVQLQPQRYYFASRYPPEMDYCLISCEEAPLFNVTPVHMALTEKGWAPVEEGDVVLIVEHPIGDVAGTAAAPLDGKATFSSTLSATGEGNFDSVQAPYVEQKRFEEVLRCRGNVSFLKSNGGWRTAGCPAFNEHGQLVGLQSQSRADGEGVVNRILSLISIVKHLFANVQLPHLPQEDVTFEDVWDTWYLTNDITRIIAILANFKGKSMTRQVIWRLCELTAKPQLVKSIASNGGIEVILQNLSLFCSDEKLSEIGLRALWNVSIGEEAHLATIIKKEGVHTILDVVESFPANETVLEFGVVLLHNIVGCRAAPNFSEAHGARALKALYPGFQQFRESVVLQKFALSFFATLARLNEEFARDLVQQHVIEHITHLIEEKPKQIFLMEIVVGFVAELAQYPHTVELMCNNTPEYAAASMAYLIDLLIHIILEYKDLDSLLVSGNRALWGLGNAPTCRGIILENPRGIDALRISLPALIASTHR
ncbi:conserved hypothetical protein [Leishmania infantum JPCM5]|uniref:Uncharacterized protein n=3 Tax=Leishmania donovani species complex TaxID=38574 RepID=A4ICJ8_LEIIN|nr:conserved hypothetical protein [Leishmania infantum JPCM5]CAM72576.1 conserved hypothetical protein [Leishmania infantum JPCM5]|eukprot:XP_001469467.1 conserved hypothetical protein [Leishmania infantum JPCM5]